MFSSMASLRQLLYLPMAEYWPRFTATPSAATRSPSGNCRTGRAAKLRTTLAVSRSTVSISTSRRTERRLTELVTQLLEAREERLLLRLKAQLARLDLLVLD